MTGNTFLGEYRHRTLRKQSPYRRWLHHISYADGTMQYPTPELKVGSLYTAVCLVLFRFARLHRDKQRQTEANRDKQRQAEANRGKQRQTEINRDKQR